MTEGNQNAVKEGLFTRDAYVRPGEEADYTKIIDEMFADLLPEGALEMAFVSEIVTASWRLRRCRLAEGNLVDQTQIDPMEDEAFDKKQRAIDRARAHALNTVRRSLAELRKLQTERATRRELQLNHEESVLVDSQLVSRNIHAWTARDEKSRERMRKAHEEELQNMYNGPIVPPARKRSEDIEDSEEAA